MVEDQVLRSRINGWIRTNVPTWSFEQSDLTALSHFVGTDNPRTIDSILRTAEVAEERPMALLYNGCQGGEDGEGPDIWLLGWRRRDGVSEGTDIHDHCDSEAGIYVLRGAVNEEIYAFDPRDHASGREEFPFYKSHRRAEA